MNIKYINAKQAIEIHAYMNTKRKLYKTNAAIRFNKLNVGIINSITRLHLVGYFYGFILRCTDP